MEVGLDGWALAGGSPLLFFFFQKKNKRNERGGLKRDNKF
jgi:hypothetical protein